MMFDYKGEENPCSGCSEYDPDIGAPCFYYNGLDKCPIGWDPDEEDSQKDGED